MQKKSQQKFTLRLFMLFVIVTASALVFANWLDEKKINHLVVIGANVLLLVLTLGCMAFYAKASVNPNPNVFIRSVMGVTFVKLMAIVVAVAVYLFAAGKDRSIYAVFVGMGLYIVYSVIEVSAVLQLNTRKDGQN